MNVTIMTYNVENMMKNLWPWNEHFWLKRSRLIVKNITDADPDIVCMQESRKLHSIWLKHHLKGYARASAKMLPFTPEHCGILYKKDKFSFVDGNIKLLPSDNYLRLYTKVVLHNDEIGDISIYDAHISSDAHNGAEQFDIINNTIISDNNFSILCGDLNQSNRGQSESCKLYDIPAQSTTFHDYGKQNSIIDYIMTNKEVSVNYKYVINDLESSDHNAFVADIAVFK